MESEANRLKKCQLLGKAVEEPSGSCSSGDNLCGWPWTTLDSGHPWVDICSLEMGLKLLRTCSGVSW